MKEKDPNAKYLTLWLCVIVSAGIIFSGWLFSVKYNFKKINDQMQNNGATIEKATAEMEDMFAGMNVQLEKASEQLKEVEKNLGEEPVEQAIKPAEEITASDEVVVPADQDVTKDEGVALEEPKE